MSGVKRLYSKQSLKRKANKPPIKQPKYNNRKVEIDGHKFDSKLEAQYYEFLKHKKATGKIKDFSLQPRYTLQETFKRDGKTYRSITYIADFEVLHNDGSTQVIDVKGMMTDVFKIKAKMFTKLYGKLYLVKSSKAGFKLEEF